MVKNSNDCCPSSSNGTIILFLVSNFACGDWTDRISFRTVDMASEHRMPLSSNDDLAPSTNCDSCFLRYRAIRAFGCLPPAISFALAVLA